MEAFFKQTVTREALKKSYIDLLDQLDDHARLALADFANEDDSVVTDVQRNLVRYARETRWGIKWFEPYLITDEWYDYDWDDVIMYEYVWVGKLRKQVEFERFKIDWSAV